MNSKVLSALLILTCLTLVSCAGESQPLIDNPRGSQTLTTTSNRSGDTGVNERGEASEEDFDEDEVFYDSIGSRDRLTRSFSDMNLTDETVEEMARRILELQDMRPGKFPVSGNISMTLVMLKYMASLVTLKSVREISELFLKVLQIWQVQHFRSQFGMSSDKLKK